MFSPGRLAVRGPRVRGRPRVLRRPAIRTRTLGTPTRTHTSGQLSGQRHNHVLKFSAAYSLESSGKPQTPRGRPQKCSPSTLQSRSKKSPSPLLPRAGSDGERSEG